MATRPDSLSTADVVLVELNADLVPTAPPGVDIHPSRTPWEFAGP